MTSAGGAVGKSLAKAFGNKYAVAVEFITMPGGAGATRIINEQKAGLFVSDLYMGGNTSILVSLKPAGALAALEPQLLLPELTDPQIISKTWWNGALRWLDKDRTNLGFVVAAPPPVVINTDLVTYEEVKSWNNLLEPKWKGKIILHDPTRPGFGGKLAPVLGEIMGWDYVKQLARQVDISANSRLIVEWTSRGKYPIALAPQTAIVTQFQRAGAPLKAFIPVEGIHITSSSGSMALLRNAPHPNATKIFINWLLTKEGQTVFSQAFGQPSARLDVSTEGMLPESIPQPGMKYVIGDSEEFILQQPQQFEKTKEVFTPLVK
ncbi:MAG: extracellular solute-binding protein [Desulfobacterales bacterium]|nr:extracellular solute-binding protein [Desulfobacterales bacterium]